jgi:hypothetical protein
MEENINVREYRRKGQSKMDNLEKLVTYVTQDEEKQHKNIPHYMLDTIMRKQTQNNIIKT